MGSIMVNRACPQCRGLAIEDDYYKIGEKYIYCYCCGYTFIREQYFDEIENKIKIKEVESSGYGIFSFAKKDGSNQLVSIHTPITDELINEYKVRMENEDGDSEKSYLVSYSDGEFNILFGNVPKRYLISYEEYKKEGYLNVLQL
jgi:hypothetical protein